MFKYDKAGRLETENTALAIAKYEYNLDGSISKVKDLTEEGSETSFEYVDSRLLRMVKDNGGKVDTYTFLYDVMGNCNYHLGASLNWERGNLLKSYEKGTDSVKYSYNNQSIRIKKEKKDGETITYYLEGEKLLGENRIKGTKATKIRYIYDLEGIIGFFTKDNCFAYYYVKDAMGNVIALLYNGIEVASYEYDAWGKCKVTKDKGEIGELNPIRWKSQYYDTETGLYYIGGRYYSPEIKRYLSPLSPEGLDVSSSIDLYVLTLTDPVNTVYNTYNIQVSIPIVYDPPKLSNPSQM